ncbi:hypothetical protein [Streptococcus dysgalactiae]|uniref:hypothetical protein n=1 Tax=Streptococcus dysgalactiae TaxID=1334 RepID=UPI003DA1C79C
MMRFVKKTQIDRKLLVNQTKALLAKKQYDDCFELLADDMKKNPHLPEPHNLMGILLEEKGDHLLAMKHFRVALDLDPTYLPAEYNLEHYGSFSPSGHCAYDKKDCLHHHSSLGVANHLFLCD